MTDYRSPALTKEAYTKIIDTAIRKAVKNGWERGQQLIDNEWEYYDRFAMPEDEPDVAIADPYLEIDGYSDDYVSIRDIIYDKGFARALWPEVPGYRLDCPGCKAEYSWWDAKETEKFGCPPSKFCNICGTKLKKVKDANLTTSPWWTHLRAMVVVDDALEYLGAHI